MWSPVGFMQPSTLLRAGVWTLIGVYGLVPSLLLLFPEIQHTFIFLHIVKDPRNNYTDLGGLGVSQPGRNLRLEGRLGLWHVLPASLAAKAPTDQNDAQAWEALIRDSSEPVILYLHGNAGTRASGHRVDLYNRLATELGAHVLALDYRGFADSDGWPSQTGVEADSAAALRYALRLAAPERVIVWGHSLGTAITVSTLVGLPASEQPGHVILESPFDSFEHEVAAYPLCRPYALLPTPLFRRLLIEPCRRRGITMDSAQIIHQLRPPILILMAEDDNVVPFALAEALRAAAEAGGKAVTFEAFSAQLGLAHKHIWRAPSLISVLRRFLASSTSS